MENTMSKKHESMINSFNQLDYTNPNLVLSWFYESCNCKMIFENDRIVEYICNKLKSYGYVGNSDINALESLKELICFKDSTNPSIIATSLINQIITYIEINKNLSQSLVFLIQSYMEKYDKEKTYSMMMKNLKDNIGKNVVFSVFKDNNICLEAGVLESVDEYSSITVNGERIPFIGYNIAISEIDDENNNVLYSNKRIGKNTDLNQFNNIEKLSKEIFGDNINVREKVMI